jgi:hypothetical protein
MEKKLLLMINKEAVFTQIMGYTKTTYLRDLGVFLYKVKCQWEHYMRTLGKKEEVSQWLQILAIRVT